MSEADVREALTGLRVKCLAESRASSEEEVNAASIGLVGDRAIHRGRRSAFNEVYGWLDAVLAGLPPAGEGGL